MKYSKQAKHSLSFNLIEVMIVVVIISILAAIAIQAYSDYVIRGKLTEATSNLGQLRIRAEQWFQDNRTYVGMLCAPANAAEAKYQPFQGHLILPSFRTREVATCRWAVLRDT